MLFKKILDIYPPYYLYILSKQTYKSIIIMLRKIRFETSNTRIKTKEYL